MLTVADIDAIERAATAALTYAADVDAIGSRIVDAETGSELAVCFGSTVFARHIAATQPSVVLELVAELRSQRADWAVGREELLDDWDHETEHGRGAHDAEED